MILKLMLWLILSLSAAAPIDPIVDKETTEKNLVISSVANEDGDGIASIDILDEGSNDGLHTHSSSFDETNRDPKLTFNAGDVTLSGTLTITGDNAKIASIITNDVSEAQEPREPQDSMSQDPQIESGASQNKAVNGGYTAWSAYGVCSKSCGGGTQERSRTCTNPEPLYNGLTCEEQNLGLATETKDCNLGPCPVNGGYTEWSEFGTCSVSCGDGIEKRSRTCTNPEPHNGLTCEEQNLGHDTETKDCNLGRCPDCSCSDWINDGGFGNCETEHPDHGFICWVNNPSTCSDLQGYSLNPGKFISAEACTVKEIAIIQAIRSLQYTALFIWDKTKEIGIDSSIGKENTADENELLEGLSNAALYLEGSCDSRNKCKPKMIESFNETFFSTYQKIGVTESISESFWTSLGDTIQHLEVTADKAMDIYKPEEKTITECEEDNCSCNNFNNEESPVCRAGEFCREGICIKACKVSDVMLKELNSLDADCICNQKNAEQPEFCPKSVEGLDTKNICEKTRGCQLYMDAFFWFFLIG